MEVETMENAPKRYFKEGIRLAEEGDWEGLLARLDEDPSIARHKDHYGMLPLHWACTEDDVPSYVLQQLIDAYPEGALTKNNAQMLPIHIAIRAKALPTSLEILCAAHPSCVVIETSYNKRPLELAEDVGLLGESLAVLRKAEKLYLETEHPNDEANDSELSSSFELAKIEAVRRSQEVKLANPKDVFEDSLRRSSMSVSRNADSRSASDARSSGGFHRGSSGIPRSSNGYGSIDNGRRTSVDSKGSTTSSTTDLEHCGVCGKNFSMFTKKYHCHSCGMSMCKKHNAGEVSLPNFYSKKSVCISCFDVVGNNSGNAADVASQRASAMKHSPEFAHRGTESNRSSRLMKGDGIQSYSASASKMDSKVMDNIGEPAALERHTSNQSAASENFSDTASLTDSEAIEEVHALRDRVTHLEYAKARVESQLLEQEKLHAEAMLLLTQTMTRVAELEMKMAMACPHLEEEDGDSD